MKYAQPYVESETKYLKYKSEDTTGQTWEPFYVPFPAANTFTVAGSATEITFIDEFSVQVKMNVEDTKFSFEI